MGSQQFCLKWNNHQSNMLTVFEQLLSNEAFVDVTLACEGLSLKAHKMVLSACSPFFQALFVENPCKHPIVILKDTRYMDLKAIVEFMYRGEVNVSQDQLSALLKTAETLKVKGLAEVTGERSHNLVPVNGEGTRPSSPPLAKRKRGRPRRRSASDSNRSDSEDQSARVKGAPDSPEIIEDGSLSCDRLSLPTPAKVAARTSTTTAAAVVPVTTSAKDSSVHEDTMPVDDAAGSPADDVDFEVDASNLMEQSMTTENARVFPDVQSSTLVLAEASTHHTASSQESTQLATSLPSDISISSQDIKPAPSSLIPYNDPSASSSAVVPTQPPSAVEAASGGSLLFMDSSGVPAIPGPSNYNADKQPSTPSHDLRSPEALEEEADLCPSKEKESDAAEIPTPRLRRKPPSPRVCNLPFAEQVSKNVGRRWCGGSKTHEQSSGELLETQKRRNASRKRHVCNICKKAFLHKSRLGIHSCTHAPSRPFASSVCQKSSSRRDVPLPKRLNREEADEHQVESSLEAKVDRSETSLSRLRRRHPSRTVSSSSFKEDGTEKVHKPKTGVDKTEKHSHEELLGKQKCANAIRKRFVCTVCEKSFSKKSHLDRHILIHTGERPFQCNVCEKSFSQKYTLDAHNRVHTGERAFKCNVCEKSFSHKCNLDRHIRVHTGERAFKCNVCEKSFSHKCNLDSHIRLHTGEKPFKCNVCEQSFSDKSNLNSHIHIHSGERPFKCNVCSKSFLQKASLLRHARIHIGKRPFKCKLCEIFFSHERSLRAHLHSHMRNSL